MSAPCPRCARIHVPSMAVGRVTWAIPLYRAQHEGAPLRDSREQADVDQCDRNAALAVTR
jgi:hypothetical protein